MSSEQNKTLLSITDLCIDGFSNNRWHQIVKHVNLGLDHGDILGLIGESGAGKSTIGIAAMGYAKPGCRITQGSIKFDNLELTTATEEEKRILRGSRIAYVAQSAAASFNPAHKLIDQFSECVVQHGIGSRQQAYADAKDLYNRIKMPDPNRIGFRYPHQVSGGQLQRAMTAMALSCRPNLIIFDEPTTALDVTTQIEVLSTIRDIVQQFNTAAIYISHDLAIVAQMADKILVLRDGEPIEEAETRTMISNPKQKYTKSLWAVRSFQKSKTSLNPQTRPHIKVERVTAAYTKSTDDVLIDVNFEIMQGETVAIVGESGSGKSTMARVITGLLPPKNGMIFYEGAQLPDDYRNRTAQQLQKIQMIYQMPDTAINPRHKIRHIVGRQLSLHLDLEGDAKQRRLEDLMDMVDMTPTRYLDRYPEELSGGQKQRVCIARALAANPSFVICDEVTSALDKIIAEGILRLLDRLQQELKLAYMFITHDLATVKAIADRVVVMRQGCIVEQGSRSEVFDPPYHEYTELLLSSVPEMDPDWMDRVIANRLQKNRMQPAKI
jgi:peptide/nickel transport system ATP-binding protein